MSQTPQEQAPPEHAMALIDRIEALVNTSLHIPLTSKVLVDQEDVFELLEHLRTYLPVEIQQAQQVISHQAEILQEARLTAERIVAATKEKTRAFLNEHELVKQAERMAADTRQIVAEETKRQRYEADKYSEQVLADLESKVQSTLGMVKKGRQNLNQTMEESAQRIGL